MKLMQYIKQLIFGVRAHGNNVPPPSFRTMHPTNRPSEAEWSKEFKFGSRYGHRGTFYQNN